MNGITMISLPDRLFRDAAFVLRCSGAAALSYLLATSAGLPRPVWAAMSAIIVSQERLEETRGATFARLLGTIIGIVVAVAIGSLMAPLGAGIAVQMTLAVALCAVIARRWSRLRVCMWTTPIVFLTPVADLPSAFLAVGLDRGLEVTVGGLTAVLLHAVMEVVLRPWLAGKSATPPVLDE